MVPTPSTKTCLSMPITLARCELSIMTETSSGSSGIQGYYVYRGGQSRGPYTKISSLQPGTTYADFDCSIGSDL